ncbi:glycosyltransferase family 4 protein [Salmonirosea aquatica]|uniref:Glycosyltransferase n=1 Tax=Salmonirosea aquatica TaxID=2654236 RepID=A0A7C9FN88_9BACT|nr:glycosyltransferase [Cytophagaceae bacterium SJW1-29]
MLKVFFDHQKFSTQRYGGISRYFATLIDHIRRDADFDYETGVVYSQNHYLPDRHALLDNALAKRFFSIGPVKNRIYDLNQTQCVRLLKANAFDVFHPTYYDPYFLEYLKKPLVVTIHDMTYERLPEYFWAQDPLSQQKRLNIERADLIIAISEATKHDLLDLFPAVKPEKVRVVYHGIDLDTPLIVSTMPDLPSDYLLFVGDRSGYKNFYLLLEAFRTLSRRYPDLHLVLAGGGNLEVAEHEAIGRAGLTGKITHRHASDAELNTLYQQATLFVYPSLYEGFGLPILEAFRAECPILLSDTACFREIAADAAAFFEPRSQEDLTHQIQTLLDDSALRRELVKKGQTRLLDFPIEACVQTTLDLYKSLV